MGVGLVACLAIFGMVWKRRRTWSYCEAMKEDDTSQRAQEAQCSKGFITSVFHNTRDCRSKCIIWNDLHPSSQTETRSHRVRNVEPKNSMISQDSSVSPRRILLVEDTEINRIILGRVLQTLNLRCEEAENGKVAVDYFKQGRTYDLVLMDKEMPVMDGHEATRQLRSMGVKTPIVALTTNTMQSDKDLFFDAGLDDFQAKPLSRDRLVQLLARYGVEGCAGNKGLKEFQSFIVLYPGFVMKKPVQTVTCLLCRLLIHNSTGVIAVLGLSDEEYGFRVFRHFQYSNPPKQHLTFLLLGEGRVKLVVKCELVMESASTDSKEGIIFSIRSVNVEVVALSKGENVRNLEMNLDGKDDNLNLQITELNPIDLL